MKISQGPGESWERLCFYGDPKTGKTRIATSLAWGEKWGEKAIYVPYDPGGENLKSVVQKDRFVVVKPDGKPNYLEEAVQIATEDWKAKYPGVKTLIWDTMTQTSRSLLQEYADKGVFSQKHAVQLGKQGTKSWHTSPMEGDYGAAQNSIGFILSHLWAQEMNVICLFHARWVEPKAGSADGLIGGPDVVGQAAVRWIAGQFDSVFRTEVKFDPQSRKAQYLLHTVNKGIWKAGYRTGNQKQLLPETVVVDRPEEFWEEYTKEMQEGGVGIWKVQ